MITFAIVHQSYFVVGYDPVAVWENLFSDVSAEDWFYSAVAYVSYYGYVSGDGAGHFFPNVTLTRAQLAALLWNLEGKPAADGIHPFTDVPEDEWYCDAVLWAAENGVVSGDGEGFFLPDKTITRQEMIQMLYNYAVNFKGYEIPQNRDMPEYTDADEVVAWAESAVKALAEAGVLNGLPEGDDDLMPDSEASRGEAAQLIKDFLRLIAGE
ncbi:MAG: S-layer homology domain-containing protein, partial [Oscillospiraceae bacterium]|nr:S-layer homology domain-containing protein [Oscillospiraceae bacterium]